MTPITWPAGQTTLVTITGTYLCYAIDEIIIPAGGVWQSQYSVQTKTELQFTVTPDADDPNETVTVKVGDDNDGNIWGNWVPVTAQIVNKCTPTIASITPSTWFAGKTYDNVVIKGTGFITTDKATAACPVTDVNIVAVDGTVVPVSNVNVVDKTKITATIAPDASTTTEQATVTVGTAPNTGTSASLATPPEVLGNEIHCDPSLGCTQDVISTTDGSDPPVQGADAGHLIVVGQRIHLTTLPLPSSLKAKNMTWKVDGTRIAGYNPTTAPTNVTNLTDADMKKSDITFYWVYPNNSGPAAVTYKYCADIPGVTDENLKCSLVANAVFNVTGPTAQITPRPYLPYSYAYWWVSPQDSACNNRQYLAFGFLNMPSNNCDVSAYFDGVAFEATNIANVPASGGDFLWVQLVTNDVVYKTQNGVALGGVDQGTGLDNTYPYNPHDPNNTVQGDAPNMSLNNTYSAERRSFAARMYLMWQPPLPSIPVPIGYVDWSTSGKARKSKKNPPWSLSSQSAPITSYTPSTDSGSSHGLPTWSTLVVNQPGTASEDAQTGGNEEGEQ